LNTQPVKEVHVSQSNSINRPSCLIYSRVSDPKQSGGSSQVTNARHLARVHALDVLAEVEDDGLSGDDLDRPGLADVLDRLGRAHRQKRPIAWVVVDQADRLSRADSLETSELLLKMRRLGVHKVATPARIFDLFDPLDRTLLQIEADHKNNPYLKDLGRRALNGMLDTARAGFWTGQRPPLGYLVVRSPGEHAKRGRKSGRLVLDPETAPLVLALFERYRDGFSTRDLARWLSARTGRRWTRQGVQRILERELYAGTRVFGTRTSGRHAHLVDGVAVVKANGDEAEGDIVRLAGFPAIVSPELFAVVQHRLATGRTCSRKKSVPPSPLAGLCRCGLCGSPMYSCRQGPYPYLCCSRLREQGKAACPGSIYVRGDVVLLRVLTTLAEQLLEGDAVTRLVELAGEAEDEAKTAWEKDLAIAEKALAGIDTRLATARRRMASAPEDLLEEYQCLVLELREERKAAVADLDRLRTLEPAAEEGDAELLTRWLTLCRQACEDGMIGDEPEQNALLRELVAEVRVRPPDRPKRGNTVGRVEVVLPEWLSRVLATTAGSGCARST
jgi:site-specific DNA recombinase